MPSRAEQFGYPRAARIGVERSRIAHRNHRRRNLRDGALSVVVGARSGIRFAHRQSPIPDGSARRRVSRASSL
jgi:hypothetical protein